MIPRIRVFAKAGTKPLFGGWDDTDQMFYEIRDIDYYDKTITVWGCHNKDCGTCDDTYKMDDVEIMMSTGLKDKNGVEIFEGDIVHLTSDEGIDYSALIVFKDGGFCAIDGTESNYGFRRYDLSRFDLYLDVIGNVHENPELLEVVQG